MNEVQRKQCSHLRSLSSNEAADWLISEFSREKNNQGEAIVLLNCRSWKKSDQVKLANSYLEGIPFSNDAMYKALFSFMSVKTLINTFRDKLPEDGDKTGILHYHLQSIARKSAKNSSDLEIVDKFLKELEESAS